jgi:hypothetical protein
MKYKKKSQFILCERPDREMDEPTGVTNLATTHRNLAQKRLKFYVILAEGIL